MSSQPARAVSIAVVDYGMGNRRSVEKALEHVGARATITSDHATLRAADGLLLPGVGSFPLAMRNLRELGLDELMRERLSAGVPLLGVCLGMQLAFERSSEHGGADGLALVDGEVHALDAQGRKLPHIGWNEVTFARSSPLLDGLPQSCAFYHVHSYAAVPSHAQDVLGTAEYGQRFASAIERAPLYGVQFHPEKSSAAGLQLLANFARICSAAPALAGAGARAGR
ncbi:MAG TPA: imidazole glycerol phosphate synthase subunit HisH [Solirubrobacteraceae bacterium]|nr:imidazole glycerol phosphate synthase subunit HisH [Solirubrobacteraceae bacterium]